MVCRWPLTLQDLYIQVHSLDWLLYYITNYVCALSKSTLCQKYMKEYRRYFGHFLDWLLVLLLLYYLEENIYFYFDTIIIVSPGKAPNTYFTSSCIFGIMYYSITIFCIYRRWWTFSIIAIMTGYIDLLLNESPFQARGKRGKFSLLIEHDYAKIIKWDHLM